MFGQTSSVDILAAIRRVRGSVDPNHVMYVNTIRGTYVGDTDDVQNTIREAGEAIASHGKFDPTVGRRTLARIVARCGTLVQVSWLN